MKSNRISQILAFSGALLVANIPVVAAEKPAKKPTLMIGNVIAIDAVQKLAKESGNARDLEQLIQTLDPFFQNEVAATRKFQIVGANKATLGQLIQVQEYHQSGMVNPETAAHFGQLTGAQLIAVPSIVEFLYGKETRKFGGVGKSVDLTVLRVRCILNVYDTSKGTLKGTAKFKHEEYDSNLRTALGSVLSKQVIGNIAEKLAGQMSNRVVDVEFPPRVILAIGKQVAFNRGDQSGIKKGDIWGVYATQKEELEGEVFEAEIEVGEIKITRITPKLSYGVVQGENLGIAKGCVVRPKETEETKKNKKDAETLRDRIKKGEKGKGETEPSLRDKIKKKF